MPKTQKFWICYFSPKSRLSIATLLYRNDENPTDTKTHTKATFKYVAECWLILMNIRYIEMFSPLRYFLKLFRVM